MLRLRDDGVSNGLSSTYSPDEEALPNDLPNICNYLHEAPILHLSKHAYALVAEASLSQELAGGFLHIPVLTLKWKQSAATCTEQAVHTS